MDAISYFFVTLITHNLLLAVPVLLLGLFLGWLIWARRSQINVSNANSNKPAPKQGDADTTKLQSQLEACKKARLGLQSDLDASELKVKELTADLAKATDAADKAAAQSADTDNALTAKVAALTGGLGLVSGELDGVSSKVSTLQAELDAAQSALTTCQNDLSTCQSDLSTCQNDLGTCQSDLGASQADLSSCNTALSAAQSDLEAAQNAATTAPASEPTPSDTDDEFTVNETEEEKAELRQKNLQFFAADLESGRLKDDEKYGLVYTETLEQDEQDDLTRIKGVAKVLNKTLNDYGVFKYRQIALWTPQICDDFSDRISFKGRVERDNWIGQCKKFHEDKYGEKI